MLLQQALCLLMLLIALAAADLVDDANTAEDELVELVKNAEKVTPEKFKEAEKKYNDLVDKYFTEQAEEAKDGADKFNTTLVGITKKSAAESVHELRELGKSHQQIIEIGLLAMNNNYRRIGVLRELIPLKLEKNITSIDQIYNETTTFMKLTNFREMVTLARSRISDLDKLAKDFKDKNQTEWKAAIDTLNYVRKLASMDAEFLKSSSSTFTYFALLAFLVTRLFAQ